MLVSFVSDVWAMDSEALESRMQETLRQRAVAAIERDPVVQEVKRCLDQGLDVESCNGHGVSLFMLAAGTHADVCELLIEYGADVFQQKVARGWAGDGDIPLMEAAYSGHKKSVRAILTTIPPTTSKSIKACMPGLIALHYAQPALPKPIRLLIGQKLVDILVGEQMPRIKQMLTFRSKQDNRTANEVAASRATPYSFDSRYRQRYLEVARMLDLSDQQSYKKLLMQIEAKIKRILFGKPHTIIKRRK